MPIRPFPSARRAAAAVLVTALAATPHLAAAQTDYYNTDRGRPLQVQDAHAIERYALELQAAPLRWSRAAGPHIVFAVEPKLAWGILPRTQLEVGLPVFVTDGFDAGPRSGVGAVHVSALHALNVETLGMPALALEAAVAIPAGRFGPSGAYATVGAIATRTVGFGRVHLNAQLTGGRDIAADDARLDHPRGVGLEELSRWTAGVAVDRTFPLRSMLLGAELVARRPIVDGAEVQWQAAGGMRLQLSPQWALDAGVGRSFGDDREWSLTVGAAWAFGLLTLIPAGR